MSRRAAAGVGEGAEDLALFRRVTLDTGEGSTVAVAPKVAFLFLTNSGLRAEVRPRLGLEQGREAAGVVA